MRGLFAGVGLLVVLAAVALSARNALHANQRFLPAAAASGAASAPFGGGNSPGVAQFQQELDKTMRAEAARAASAGDAADAAR
jgi:hypothetical protein